MNKILLSISITLLSISGIFAQQNSGVIKGRVYNAKTNEGVPFATVQVWGTTIGAVTDFDGNFIFTGIKPGFAELRVSSLGFKPFISSAVMVTNSNQVNLEIPLEEADISIGEVVIKASPFAKKIETPISVRIIGIDEIEKNPGGNRDISKVIQSYPGVASTPAFRNDVIVRGGGPNENRFYVDNVEIPYLNHFSTQGASGGPVGILNVDFVQSVDFLHGDIIKYVPLEFGLICFKVQVEIVFCSKTYNCEFILWIEPYLVFHLEIGVCGKEWKLQSTEQELEI